ncbi:hypothetical protein [Pseudonocardia sp.]|uniref:hypothetical protein n=1 Tax=Pseudonocardia sp. TaxID=60912 RepID=UPI0026205312|nr:hypothetical protein [Pseudonocardia sp.]
MNRRPERAALRTARTERAWSQTAAARELRALARARDGPEATAASLKTQLSRWENGHAVPEPEYRVLLAELYGRTPEQLGLLPEPEHASTATERVRARLAAAAAVDNQVVALWTEQLTLAQRLDDELGATGAGELVRVQVGLLQRTLEHTLSSDARATVAGVLTGAAALAGRQALDQGDPEEAWQQYGAARAAAQEAGSPGALVRALAGQAEVLREIGEAAEAVGLLEHAASDGPPAARVRLAAARGAAYAAAGDAAGAQREFDRAARALATGGLAGTRPDPGRADRGRPDRQQPDRGAPDPPHPPDRPSPDPRPPGQPRADQPPPELRPPDLGWAEARIELADLHRWHGHALAALHDPAAVPPLESALAAAPRAARHRAALHADLAVSLATVGRSDEAAEHAGAARRLAERIGSQRIAARLASSGFPRQVGGILGR